MSEPKGQNMTATPVPQQPEDSGIVSLPEGLSAEQFKLAFRNHPAGVAVITADSGSGPVGLTATSVFSVSAEPPILVFSLSSLSSSAPTIDEAETVVVHLLGGHQLGTARRFATHGIDRFADPASWSRLITGEPYLVEAPVWVRGRIIDRMRAGGSTIVAVHALQAHLAADAHESTPLVYHNRAWHGLGEHSLLQP